MVLDSNIVIYLAQPGGETLQEAISSVAPAASLISRVETLGFHQLNPEERERLEQIFAWVEVLPVNDPVADAAILLRQARRMKLGDALIAATALLYDLPLMTRNEADFKHVPGLRIINPFSAKSAGGSA